MAYLAGKLAFVVLRPSNLLLLLALLGLFGIGHRRRLTDACHQEVVYQVRVRATVSSALQKRQVLGVLNRRRLRDSCTRDSC